MNTLYLIGGSPRCGKTIIFNEVIQKKPMIAIPTDAIRAGVRYLNRHKRIDFSEEIVENQLPWEMIVGIIQRYDHKDIPLIIEGVVITPERVKSLELKHLRMRTVFVGFTADSYVEKILEYGHREKDWVFDAITKNEGSDLKVREMCKSLQEKNKRMLQEAKSYGYAVFSPDNQPFEEYKNEVVEYLLG